MRKISKIILHCSATRAEQDVSAADIDRWHRECGWAGIGYHYVIRRGGQIEPGRAFNTMGAHVKGQNVGSVGICLVGGHGSSADDRWQDHFTPAQMHSLYGLVSGLMHVFPDATLHGHNEYAAKACPGFRVANGLLPEIAARFERIAA